MVRRLAVAALGVAFLTFCLASTVWAQRGGGGHAGGFGGGHVGGISHGGFASPGFSSHQPSPVSRSGVIITNGWGYGHGGYPYHGYGYGYPYRYGRYGRYGWGWGGGWWYPWWGWSWDSDSSYQSQPAQYYSYPDNSYYQQQASQQQDEIDRLNDEVARLREARPSQSASALPAALSQPTELVYRDKHTEKIDNYAIVGQTLWILNEQRSRKIPLAQLDIPATEQANEAHGVEFNLPR